MATFPIPNLHILGVQKAGTTALSHFLSQHPDICLVEGKEAHVFDDPDYFFARDKHQYALDKFASKLRHYDNQAYICDATPITLFHPAFIRDCVAFNPSAKFIVMLRDPVERAFSHYAMSRSRKLEPYGPALAFLLEPWRMRNYKAELPGSAFQHRFRDFSYLQRGRYDSQLQRLYQMVDRRQVLVLQQSQLKQNHQQTLQSVQRFLGLTYHPIAAEEVFVSEQAPQRHRFARWLAKRYFSIYT